MAEPLLHPNAAGFRLPGDGDDAVVMLHGWTGSPGHLRLLAAAVNEHGYPVSAPLLAGHGTNAHDMAASTWRDWLRSAATAAHEVTASGKRLHLVGLSMGGLLSLLLAPTFGAVSVTTISAPIRVYDRRVYASWLMRGSPRLSTSPPSGPPDTEAEPFYHHYDFTPLGSVADLYDLMLSAGGSLGRVTCPALIIQSHSDETVRPKSARMIYDGLASRHKRIVWLKDARHVALVDAERVIIHREVVAHLGKG